MTLGLATRGMIGCSLPLGIATKGKLCTAARAIANACLSIVAEAFIALSLRSDPSKSLFVAAAIVAGDAIGALPIPGVSILADALRSEDIGSETITGVTTAAAIRFVDIEAVSASSAESIATAIAALDVSASAFVDDSTSASEETLIEIEIGAICHE